MYYVIKANNPNGMDWEHCTEQMETVASVVAYISNRGGEDIRINDMPVPAETIAAAVARYVIK